MRDGNPYGITPDRLTRDDQIEIHRQWVAVQRSIDEYWRAPITSPARCEQCGIPSRRQLCALCIEEPAA